ncbi:MAG: hypothetical protein ACXACX_16370 [Candidatus Hodarchaeales archaeon]|jgi:hypothetical protein
MVEIPEDIKEKIETKDKGFVSDVLEELYTICRSTGRSCVDCSFEYDKLDFDYGNESNVEMCPLDVALVEYKSPCGSRGKIHPWVFDNIEMVYNRLQEIKDES